MKEGTWLMKKTKRRKKMTMTEAVHLMSTLIEVLRLQRDDRAWEMKRGPMNQRGQLMMMMSWRIKQWRENFEKGIN